MSNLMVAQAMPAQDISGEKAVRLARQFEACPISDLIANLTTQVGTVTLGLVQIPITVNSSGGRTCYICCPSAAYVDYARAELRHFVGQPWLLWALDRLVGLGYPLIAAAQLDRQVQANNWLLATNPLPALTLTDLTATTAHLAQAWPGHAVIWRSLNDYSDVEAIQIFRQAGYRMVPARQIYLFDCRTDPPVRHRDERRDEALLGRADLAIVDKNDFRDSDFVRISELYRALYLDKYTWLNPQYTPQFLAVAHRHEIIEFAGLRRGDGQLSGVVGFFDNGTVMTAPIVGYDTAEPQEQGLYRRLMALAMRRARSRGMLFNMSAGAASFKRNRGALAALEYSAVYDRGLPVRARLAGQFIRTLLNGIGVPLLRRFAL